MNTHVPPPDIDPATMLRSLRRQARATVARLLAFLDAIEGDPDLEEEDDGPECDTEASLGWTTITNQSSRAFMEARSEYDDELEHDDADNPRGEGDDADDPRGEDDPAQSGIADSDGMQEQLNGEPSLGSLDGRFSQKHWGQEDQPSWLTGMDMEVCPPAIGPRQRAEKSARLDNVSLEPMVTGRPRLRRGKPNPSPSICNVTMPDGSPLDLSKITIVRVL